MAKRTLEALRALFQLQPAGEHYELHPVEVDEHLFPEPSLVFYVLSEVFGFATYGPFEKMRMGVVARFRDVPFAFEWQKFGLRLFVPEGKQSDTRFQRLLQTAVRDAIHREERALKKRVLEQIEGGDVALENQYREFDQGYRFFRGKADAAYAQPEPPPVEHRDSDGNVRATSWDPFRSAIEGSYYATAMMNEYFSRLEHVFLLALAFTDFDPSNGALRAAASERSWAQKFRTLISIDDDPTAERFHAALCDLRETLRNPLTHGGLKTQNRSFYFDLKGYGVIRARFDEKQARKWPPVRCSRERYEEICALFDRFDAFLEQGRTAAAMQFVQSGLHVGFDARSRSEYRAAMESGTLEELMDRLTYLTDRETNMDY